MAPTDLQTVPIQADKSSLAVARNEIRRAVKSWMSVEAAETAVLLTNELVANALKHGGAVETVNLAFARRGDVLWVGVSQPLPFQRKKPAVTTGWGLRLVETLADLWEHEVQPDGSTIVSFELHRNGKT